MENSNTVKALFQHKDSILSCFPGMVDSMLKEGHLGGDLFFNEKVPILVGQCLNYEMVL